MIDRIRCAAIVLGILGLGFAVAGVLLLVMGDSFINDAVKKGCELRPGTPAYDAWRHPPVPLRISFYVFDLNDTEFIDNSTKMPLVRQRGPFVYKEVRTKYDVEEYENGTISYHESRNYTFDRSQSCDVCDETYNITTFNIVYMALINYLQTELHVDPIVHRIIGELLAFDEKPYMQRTVKEFLWDYEDPLLVILKKNLPKLVPDDHVSVFNASASQAGLSTFLINSGVDVHRNNSERIKQVGNIERYNFQRSVPYWTNKYANMINGTDSTIWHPGAQKTDEVYIYSPDLCRSLRLEFAESHDNEYGIENYRFVLPSTTFANSSENHGFCLNSTTENKTHEIKCLPSGLMSLRSCIQLSGSAVSIPIPIIASSPHFLDADSSVQDAVQGLKPDDTLHRSYMDLEPITGTVMGGSRRMQINLNVVNDKSIPAIANLKPFVYPLMWLDEHSEIDKKNADMFRSKVITPMTILEALKYALIAIGGILFVIVVILIIHNHHKTNSEGPAFPTVAADESSPLLI